MNNNKICPKCGTNNINSHFCVKCGQDLTFQTNEVISNNNIQNNINNNIKTNITDNQPTNNNSEGNILGIISLVLYFAGTTIFTYISKILPNSIGNTFSFLTGLCPLAGIVTMIIGRIKYPNNKFLKVVMIIIIGSIIFCVIAFILFVIWCYVTCSTMDTSGCD